MELDNLPIILKRLAGKTFPVHITDAELLCFYITLDSHEPSYNYPKHDHAFYEFHYISDGEGTIGLNNTSYQIKKGDFYMSCPNINHWHTSSIEAPLSKICLRFMPEIIPVDSAPNIWQIYGNQILRDKGDMYPIDRKSVV